MSIWREGKTWRYEFQVNKVRYTKGGWPTKAIALEKRETHKKEIKAGKQTPTGTDFRTAANGYLDYCQRRFTTKTYKEKRFIYASFLAAAGNFEIGRYDARILEAYLLTRPTSANWNKHRKNLSAFFEWCFRRGMVDGNPCIYVGTMPHQPKKKIIPTQEEILKLLLSAASLRPFFLALYSLAARVGEINKLRWEDVNFTAKTVTLWTRKGDGTSRAQIKPLNDELHDELRRLYGKQSGEWVFPNPLTDLPFVDRRKQLRRICNQANVPYMGFHSIRHFVASLLSDTYKVSLPTIQGMLGHARLTTTERYIQSLGDGVREASDLLQIFTNKAEPQESTTRAQKKELGD